VLQPPYSSAVTVTGGQSEVRVTLKPVQQLMSRVVREDGGVVTDLEIGGQRFRDAGSGFVYQAQGGAWTNLDVFAPNVGAAYVRWTPDASIAEIAVGQPRIVKVEVKGSGGKPIEVTELNVPLSCWARGGGERTGADGVAWVELPYPTSRVMARATGHTWVTVAARGSTIEVTLERASGKVSGVMKGKNGPIAGATVCVEGDRGAFTTTTNASGGFSLIDVPPGAYRASASTRSGTGSAEQRFELGAVPVRVELRLKP